jgi:hypothetical protein
MWKSIDDRLALLELLAGTTLKLRRAQDTAFTTLRELPWTRETGRRDEIELVESRRFELVNLLDRVWSEWRDTLAELVARGLPPTPDGWSRLTDARRAEGIPPLPARINKHTAAALAAPHSKSTLTESRLAALGDVDTTHDGSIRLRPPAGLLARTPRGDVDLSRVADLLGEVSIAERAFLDGMTIAGDVRALLLVENLGAWRDLTAPAGWLIVHVPGWNTATVARLLAQAAHWPTVHFGDLDPAGVRIYRHLRSLRPELRWLVPAFWRELVELHGLPTRWPDDLDLADAPDLVRELARAGLWLEHERVSVDPRIASALEAVLDERA